MSLSTPTPVKTYSYGLLVSKSFDDPQLLHDLFLDKLESVGHLYVNGANPIVVQFAQENGLILTAFPITGGRVAPWAISRVVESSDAVYIIADEESKSAKLAVETCERKAKNEEKFRWKFISFDPATKWRTRVFAAKEILACATPEDGKRNLWMDGVGEALDS